MSFGIQPETNINTCSKNRNITSCASATPPTMQSAMTLIKSRKNSPFQFPKCVEKGCGSAAVGVYLAELKECVVGDL